MQGSVKVSKKNVKIRIVLFILAFIIAILAFSFSIASLTKRNPGYYEISAKTDEEYPGYNATCSTVLYFDNENDSIKNKISQATQIYTEILKDVVLRYNPYYDSSYYKGLHYLNSHLNEEVILDDNLYFDLKDAYNKTLENKNYSIFAGPLYDVWEDIIDVNVSSNNTTLDPLVNDFYKNKISDLVNYINNDSNFSLTFDDSSKTCKLNISDSYKDYRETNSIKSPIVSFNILEDAYVVKTLKSKLYSYGYNKGFVSYKDVVVTFTGESEEAVMNNAESVETLYLSMNANSSVTYLEKNSAEKSYKYSDSQGTVYRSLNLDIYSGYSSQFILNIMCIGEDIVNCKYLANYIQNKDDLNYIKDAVKSENNCDVFLLNSKEKQKYYYNNMNYISEYKIYSQNYIIEKIN